MKKENKIYNHLLQKGGNLVMQSKKLKSPTSKGSNSQSTNKNHSYSPNPSIQRDVSPLYSLTNNIHNVQNTKAAKQKIKQQKSVYNSANFSRLSMNSFAHKRLSVPKNQALPQNAVNMVQEENSLNQSVGAESFYSGEGYISKSVVGTTQIRKSKSPKNNMANNSKKRQHYSTSTSTTPAASSHHHQQHHNFLNQKKRNSQASNHGATNAEQQFGSQNSIFHTGYKQINNYIIEPSINTSQIMNPLKSKQHSQSTKSSGGAPKVLAVSSNINQNITGANSGKHAISATNKVSQSFSSAAGMHNGKFAERRLSAKIVETHKKTHSKGPIQYENLMLQQLLKQQQIDQQSTFKKNLSVISMDQPPTSQLVPHPQMLLNISYNMNNNINHHSSTADASTQFLFQQDPAQLKSLLGGLNNNGDESNSIREQSRVYKTQVDPYHQKGNKSMPGIHNLNGGMSKQSMIDAHMSYENSIVAAVKGSEQRYRDQSFDKVKLQQQKSKKKSNNNSHKRTKQLSSNSTRKNSNTNNQKNFSQSRSNSSKRRSSASGTTKHNNGMRDSSRVLSSHNPTSSHSNSSKHQSNRVSAQKINFKKVRNSGIDQSIQDQKTTLQQQNIQDQKLNEDKVLLQRLDEALTRDLQDKSSSHRVAICSKVWSEIIRREDPIIASLLTKIKQSYESHIKSQNKILAQQQKEIDFEQELKKEKQERQNAESKIENLGQELKRQQQCIEKQDGVIQDMKKQILAYRQEIIQLSTSKKYPQAAKARRDLRGTGGSDIEGMKVPRLDLSKVKRDSDDDDDDENDGESDSNIEEAKKQKGQNITYQQYLKFLENESRFDEMGEESQESLIRQEELKQRKNKIIQLLNGEISDEDEGDQIEQSSGGEGGDNYEFNDADYIQEMSLNDQSLSNPPSTVKKLNQELQMINGNSEISPLQDDANQKKKHQVSKQGNANANQRQIKQQVRDFNEQLHENEDDDDIDLDDEEGNIDLIKKNKSAQSF